MLCVCVCVCVCVCECVASVLCVCVCVCVCVRDAVLFVTDAPKDSSRKVEGDITHILRGSDGLQRLFTSVTPPTNTDTCCPTHSSTYWVRK